MRTTTLVALGAAVCGLPLVAVATVVPASAAPATPTISIEPLTPRSTFTDDITLKLQVKGDHGNSTIRLADPSRTAVVKITVPAGVAFPQHRHPGPVIVNVAQGQLTYVDDGCSRKVYPAGTAFVDTGTDVHSAVGTSTGPTVVYATFLGAPAQGLLTVPEAVQTPCP